MTKYSSFYSSIKAKIADYFYSLTILLIPLKKEKTILIPSIEPAKKEKTIEFSFPSLTSISIIVPTYKEVENLPSLIKQIQYLKNWLTHVELELLIMDDNSNDGTESLPQLQQPWIRLVVRKQNPGLSQAVIEGFEYAQHEVIIVMDADLSHPPDKIPEMFEFLRKGADFVIGSRYVTGASTDIQWGLFRWFNSKIATLLALPLVGGIKDPMSGFFAVRRTTFNFYKKTLNPTGYKIGLELLVKCNCKNIQEVPIHFADRCYGKSKLSLKEQLRYLKHLHRLYIYQFGIWTQLTQFAAVGMLGIVVNLLTLSILIGLNIKMQLAVALAIMTAMVFNFILNRRFTFFYAQNNSIIKQFFGFVTACSVGAVVNYFVTIYLLIWIPSLKPQFAALFGIFIGMFFNFFINRFMVFKK